MVCSETIVFCSGIRTKHTNIVCGQNVEFLNVNVAVHGIAIPL